MPIPHQKSSFTSSSSTANAWKLSLEDWAKVPENHYLVLPTKHLLFHDNKEVAFSVGVEPRMKNCDQIKVLLMLLNTENSEDGISNIQIETAYRIRKPSDRKPFEMYSSRAYETFHSSELNGMEDGGMSRDYELKSIYNVGTAEERGENGFITFEFEVRIVSAHEKKFQDSSLSKKQIFFKNFESFYGESGDVKITGGKEFACHKLLLTSQSPVFRAMFAHDSKENAESTVPIDDTTPEAVEEFLFFLYHGRLQRVPIASLDFASCLVHLASKYHMGVLMGICKDILVDIVDVSNVLKMMKMVDKYPELSEISVKLGSFFKENFEVIVINDDWSEFMATNPALVTNLLRAFAK
eukprot:GFUD01124191.1.p1 GENE.GFUD01124191.1~~GFUD01124191.1.p1  ORF type:complete len:353 (+),score=74.05 GFUD01124191.1:110-1168(+)